MAILKLLILIFIFQTLLQLPLRQSSPSSENPPGVPKDFEALDVLPATSVADAVVVTFEGGGKGMGEKGKSQKFSQVDAAGARRPDECKKRATSSSDTVGETDAQYLAEVAETDALLAGTNDVAANDDCVVDMPMRGL